MSSATFTNQRQVISQVATQYVAGNIYHNSCCNVHDQCSKPHSSCATASHHRFYQEELCAQKKRKRCVDDIGSRKTLFTVPKRQDDHFIQRTSIFEEINHSISLGKVAALCGLGGAGKSQIAIEYAYRFRRSCPDGHVLWVPAGNMSSIRQAYQRFAHDLQLRYHKDPSANHFQLVAERLGFTDDGSGDDRYAGEQWLIILDGLDSTETLDEPVSSMSHSGFDGCEIGTGLLEDFLPHRPRSKQVVIITTRNQDVARRLNEGQFWINVGALTLSQSRDMLATMLNTSAPSVAEGDEMEQLVQKLGHIPLAISHAAAFMNRSRITVHRYLSMLESEHQLADHLSQNRGGLRRDRQRLPLSVFQTWQISYGQIEQEDPLAATLLRLMAMLDGQQISRQLLATPEIKTLDLDQAFGTLFSYCLISEHYQSDHVSIHSLVQLCVRSWLRHTDPHNVVAEDALVMVRKSFPKNNLNGPIDMCTRAIMPHAWSVLKRCDKNELLDRYRSELQLEMSVHEWKTGSFESAHQLAHSAYRESEQLFGDQHELTLHCSYQIGAVLLSQSHLDEAEPLFLNILMKQRGKRSEADWMVLRTMSKLGTIYRHQCRLEESENIFRQVVKLSKQIHGDDSFEVWIAMGHLARSLNESRKFEEAKAVHEYVITKLEQNIGLENFSTLFCLNELATTLRNLEKCKEAETLHRRVLVVTDTIAEGKHPWKITFNSNLVSTLARLNQLQEALNIQVSVVEDRMSTMGKNNRYYWEEVRQLADIYKALERYEDAEDILQRALTDTDRLSNLIESYKKEAVNDLNSLRLLRRTSTSAGDTKSKASVPAI